MIMEPMYLGEIVDALKKNINVTMSKAMTRCSMDMLQYRCACAMYMCEDMQMHSVVKDHNNPLYFRNASFLFLDPEQRNHGHLDNDGRSCAVKPTYKI